MLRLLNDQDYEVRLCILKYIRRAVVKESGLSYVFPIFYIRVSGANTQLPPNRIEWDAVQRTLIEHIMGWETHYGAIKHSLHLLRILPTRLPSLSLEHSAPQKAPAFWERLLVLVEPPNSATVREEALCIMGLYLAEVCR